jgi:hypothetical protein
VSRRRVWSCFRRIRIRRTNQHLDRQGEFQPIGNRCCTSWRRSFQMRSLRKVPDQRYAKGGPRAEFCKQDSDPLRSPLVVSVLHREHHGVQGRQGCAGNTILCGSVPGSRMARSMGRTDGHIISIRHIKQFDFSGDRVNQGLAGSGVNLCSRQLCCKSKMALSLANSRASLQHILRWMDKT